MGAIDSHVEVLNIPGNFNVRSVMVGGDRPEMYVRTDFSTCTDYVAFVHFFTRCLSPTLCQGPLLGPGGSGEQGGQGLPLGSYFTGMAQGFHPFWVSRTDHYDPRWSSAWDSWAK